MLALLSSAAAWAQDESASSNRRGVLVSGQGEVSAKPDRARVTMGVDAFSIDLKTAEGEANKTARTFLVQARALGIADADISTTAVNINPEYAWIEQTHTQKLTGYRAQRQIEVVLRDLDKLGDLLLRSTAAGISRVSPTQLESSRAAELGNQALAKAAADAREKAGLLAEALGAKLGPVYRINAASTEQRPQPVMLRAMAVRAGEPDGNSEMGISAGDIKISANLTAEFELQR